MDGCWILYRFGFGRGRVRKFGVNVWLGDHGSMKRFFFFLDRDCRFVRGKFYNLISMVVIVNLLLIF